MKTKYLLLLALALVLCFWVFTTAGQASLMDGVQQRISSVFSKFFQPKTIQTGKKCSKDSDCPKLGTKCSTTSCPQNLCKNGSCVKTNIKCTANECANINVYGYGYQNADCSMCGAWGKCVSYGGNKAAKWRTCKYANSSDANLLSKCPRMQYCGASEAVCNISWKCSDWSECVASGGALGGKQTRVCTDKNNCGSATGKPAEKQSCSVSSSSSSSSSGGTPVNNKPCIEITSPNSGSYWTNGETRDIVWKYNSSSTNCPVQNGNIKITLDYGEGAADYMIAYSINPSQGYYPWKLDRNFSHLDQYRIRINFGDFSNEIAPNYWSSYFYISNGQ